MKRRVAQVLLCISLGMTVVFSWSRAEGLPDRDLQLLEDGLKNLGAAVEGQIEGQHAQGLRLARLEESVGTLRRQARGNGVSSVIVTLAALNIAAGVALWLSTYRNFRIFRRLIQELRSATGSDDASPAGEDLLTRLEILERISLPANAEPFLTVAEDLVITGQLRKAKDLYARAVQREPGSHAAHHGLAKALEQMGNVTEAIMHYEKSASLRPQDLAALNDLAGAQMKAEDFHGAIRTFERMLTLDQTNSAPYHNKAEALARLGRLMEALQVLNIALEKWPRNQDLRVEKGRVLIDLAEYSAAVKILNEVLGENPCHALARYNKACCLAKIGDRQLSREELLRALEVKPEMQEVASNDPDLENVWGDGLWVGQAVVRPSDRDGVKIVATLEEA